MFDLETKQCFHLRLTCERERSMEVIQLFIEKFTPVAVVTAHEFSKTEVAHSHSHIEMSKKEFDYHNTNAGKTARSAFFKKHDMAGLYNFQQLEKKAVENIKYCIKDFDIIYKHNCDDAQLETIRQMVIKIQKNMKMEQRHKLLEAFKEDHKDIPKMIADTSKDRKLTEIPNPLYPYKLWQVAQWIHHHYIDVYDKPPPVVHMREYVLYIATKECDMDTQEYYYNLFKQ